MTLPLILRPEAVHDLIVAHEWYEEQKVTLGADFLAQASAIFDRIRVVAWSTNLQSSFGVTGELRDELADEVEKFAGASIVGS